MGLKEVNWRITRYGKFIIFFIIIQNIISVYGYSNLQKDIIINLNPINQTITPLEINTDYKIDIIYIKNVTISNYTQKIGLNEGSFLIRGYINNTIKQHSYFGIYNPEKNLLSDLSDIFPSISIRSEVAISKEYILIISNEWYVPHYYPLKIYLINLKTGVITNIEDNLPKMELYGVIFNVGDSFHIQGLKKITGWFVGEIGYFSFDPISFNITYHDSVFNFSDKLGFPISFYNNNEFFIGCYSDGYNDYIIRYNFKTNSTMDLNYLFDKFKNNRIYAENIISLNNTIYLMIDQDNQDYIYLKYDPIMNTIEQIPFSNRNETIPTGFFSSSEINGSIIYVWWRFYNVTVLRPTLYYYNPKINALCEFNNIISSFSKRGSSVFEEVASGGSNIVIIGHEGWSMEIGKTKLKYYLITYNIDDFPKYLRITPDNKDITNKDVVSGWYDKNSNVILNINYYKNQTSKYDYVLKSYNLDGVKNTNFTIESNKIQIKLNMDKNHEINLDYIFVEKVMPQLGYSLESILFGSIIGIAVIVYFVRRKFK